MSSIFDSSSLCMLRLPSASSQLQIYSPYAVTANYPVITGPSTIPPPVPIGAPAGVVEALNQINNKRQKRQKKLKYIVKEEKLYYRQLKEDVEKLEAEGQSLSDQEHHLRALLDRIAKEGEDDLQCSRRRQVFL